MEGGAAASHVITQARQALFTFMFHISSIYMPLFEGRLVARVWMSSMSHDQGGHAPLNLQARVTHHEHDPMSCLGKLFLGRPLEGLEATKGIGVGRRWAPMALIGGVEPHNHLSMCSSHPFQSHPG